MLNASNAGGKNMPIQCLYPYKCKESSDLSFRSTLKAIHSAYLIINILIFSKFYFILRAGSVHLCLVLSLVIVHLLAWITLWTGKNQHVEDSRAVIYALQYKTLGIFRFIELGTRKPDNMADLIPLQLSFSQLALEKLGHCIGWNSNDGNFLPIFSFCKCLLWPACKASKDLMLAFHHRRSLWQMQIMFRNNY